MNYFIFSLVLGIVTFAIAAKKGNTGLAAIIGVIAFLLFGAVNYGAMPTLTLWGFDGVWIELAFAVIIGWLISFFDKDHEWDSDSFNWFRLLPVIIMVVLCLGRCSSSAEMFNAKEYHSLLKVEEVADTTFNNEVHPIPIEKMINVNKQYAEMLASNRIEAIPALGSRCEFGSATIINLNGSFNVKEANGKPATLTFNNEQVWVVPLEHTGFWKWFNYDTTPGYCIVSANNPERIWFITEVNGKPLALRYISTAWFGDQIERYVRTHGYASYGLSDYTMELDDNGQPYWVITTYKPRIGFSGEDATGVVIVDMQNGDMKEYNLENVPEWVDRIQPDEFLYPQIQTWGEYKGGWWNSFTKKEGVRQATPGMSMVYSEGKCYWYTGIQSVGGDRSTSGFMLINSRTKECKLYKVTGFNENLAQQVIQDNSEWVRMAKFSANPPVLYNVHGIPTYYMTLTGDGTKIAGYAFVSSKSEQLFSAASTPQKALSDYLKAVQSSGSYQLEDGDVTEKEIHKFTVREITYEDGIYYILFKEVKGIEFIGTTDSFRELKWTKPEQKVEVSFQKSNAPKIILGTFKNMSFEL